MMTCSSSGKVCHENASAARKQALQGRRRFGDRRVTVKPYQCKQCNLWHVGHQRNVRARA